MKNSLFLALLMLAIASMTSCGKILEESIPGLNCYDEDFERISRTSNDYSEALIAFNNEQSEANCQAVKRTGQAYLDALDGWADCWDTYYPDEDYEAELAEARRDLEDTCD